MVVEDKGDQEAGRGYSSPELEHDPDTLSMRKQILLHMLGFSHFPRDQGVIGFIGKVPWRVKTQPWLLREPPSAVA